MLLIIDDTGRARTQPALDQVILDSVEEGIIDVFDISTVPIKRMLTGNTWEDVTEGGDQ